MKEKVLLTVSVILMILGLLLSIGAVGNMELASRISLGNIVRAIVGIIFMGSSVLLGYIYQEKEN